MKNRTFQICIVIIMVYIVLSVAFYFIAGDSFRQSSSVTEMLSPKAVTGELYMGQTLDQKFRAEMDTIDSVTLLGATYARTNNDTLTVSLLDGVGGKLVSEKLETAGLSDNSKWMVVFPEPVKVVKGDILTLSVTCARGVPGNAVTFYYGNSINTGKFEVGVESEYPVHMDSAALDGELCMSVKGTSYYKLAQYYWYFICAIGLLLAAFLLWTLWCKKKGRITMGLRVIAAFSVYRFLLKQLVIRDFKTKYKRSVLGMFWSFLNPLLLMLVLYIVFSTLFRSSIANFSVYLLTGIVCWNFFSEATSMCLSSITGNASLIMKVYVPKYMYPFSRSVSSLVNLTLSLIPLFIVLVITRTRFTLKFLLLPYPILCLFLFSLGMGLILASIMVFFRDTQFLWGVVSTLWMYLTPIFYDVNIIPAKLMTMYKMNPLYHILRIFRVLLINGVSPEPKAYLLCFIASVVPFLIGVWIFKKTQDRFVLYL